jgi:DNA topoisomerase-1
LASLPRGANSDELTLDAAVAILAARAESVAAKKGSGPAKGEGRKKKAKPEAAPEAAPESKNAKLGKSKPKRAVRKKTATS